MRYMRNEISVAQLYKKCQVFCDIQSYRSLQYFILIGSPYGRNFYISKEVSQKI